MAEGGGGGGGGSNFFEIFRDEHVCFCSKFAEN